MGLDSHKSPRRFPLCLSAFVILLLYAPGQTQISDAYYLRSAGYPNLDHLWTLDGLADGEAQGVTNDNRNWYFTWTSDSVGYLIRVPVGVPIDNDVLSQPGVAIVNTTQFPLLNGDLYGRYWHWGDPDHFRNSGQDYILVPMTAARVCANNSDRICQSAADCPFSTACNNQQPPIIAVFRAPDLTLAGFFRTEQQSIGWCAVQPRTGWIYTSEDFDYSPAAPGCPSPINCDDQSAHCLYPRRLMAYVIDWNRVPTSGPAQRLSTSTPSPKELLGPSGESMELYNMQGGEFSPDGEVLYIVSGSGCCEGNGHGQQYYFDGLHVFDAGTQDYGGWREIKRSYNHSSRFPYGGLSKYFDFFYPLGCGGTNCGNGGEAASWSPEGLTVWDLDDGRACSAADKCITGQLHVLVFKYRVFGHNRQMFEHFSGRLYVSSVNGSDDIRFPCVDAGMTDGEPFRGSVQAPFRTLRYACDGYPAWEGAEVVLQAGSYPESVTLTRKIRLTSRGGAATVGR